MPDLDNHPEASTADALYPEGYLARLSLDELVAERERQRTAGAKDVLALVRARLCTQEMIRRRLAAMAPSELAP